MFLGTSPFGAKHLPINSRAILTDRHGDEPCFVVTADTHPHTSCQKHVRPNVQHSIRCDASIHFQR